MPNADQLLLGHTSAETAYVVDDYPYGRSRTQKRYWIESKPKHGDRLVTQTLNPKTGRWNKPKAGTYSAVLVLWLEPQEDGRDFVKTHGLGLWRTTAEAEAFIGLVGLSNLNPVQCDQLAGVIGMNKVMENVTFTVREGEQTPEEKAEQDRIKSTINRGIAVETYRARQEL
jgi:hypothetical protein